MGWVVNTTPRPLYPRERDPGIGGWVGPRAGLDECGIAPPPPTGIRSPDRPARSESLYRLRNPGLDMSPEYVYEFRVTKDQLIGYSID